MAATVTATATVTVTVTMTEIHRSAVRSRTICRAGVRGLFVRFILASAFVLGPAVSNSWADIVWTPEDGWIIPGREITATAEELFEQSEKAYAVGRYRDAALGYRLLIDTYPEAAEVEPSYRKLVESTYRARRWEECLEAISEVLQRDPSADLVEYVIERQFEIGVGYLSGERRRFLLFFRVGAQRRGVEVLDALVERFPFQGYSDDALHQIADYYFAKEQYEQATLVYRRIIRDYPQSEWAAASEFQIGAAALKQLKGVEYDFGFVDEAETRFRRYLARYPAGDLARDARRGLDEVSRLRAEKLLIIARFYVRTGEPQSARFYLQKILFDHSETEFAEPAKELLEEVVGGSR